MKSKVLILFFSLLVFQVFAQQVKEKKEEVEMYYNAAVEKYVKNDYEKAVEYMEKAYKISNEEKYRNFIIKVLYEAANKEYMMQNYIKALSFLEKGRSYTLENDAINQLYDIVKDLLSKQKVSFKKKEEEQKKVNNETLPQVKKEIPQEEKEKKKEKKVSPSQVLPKVATEQRVLPKMEKPQTPSVVIIPVSSAFRNISDSNKWLIIVLSETIVFVLIIVLLLKKQKIKYDVIIQDLRVKNTSLEKEVYTLHQEKINLWAEVENAKRNKDIYEKTISDIQKELRQKIELVEYLQKQLLEISTKQSVVNVPTTENVIEQKHKEIVGYIQENSIREDKSSEFEVESSRKRIAVMLKNLYSIDPSKAMASIFNMATDSNPTIRANIVLGLIEIGTAETFKILFKLYADPDARVRREVIKRLWLLKQRIDNKEVVLDKEIISKITEIIQLEKQKGEWLF